MAATDVPSASKGTAMTRLKAFALIAALTATVGSQHAQAGMSGTSRRVEQQAAAEAQAAIQAPPPAARPVAHIPTRSVPEPARTEQASQPNIGAFDGVWAVATSPGCGLLARSAVQVRRGRITGDSLSGSVDATGKVRTVAYGGGISVISKGHTSATAGSGTYELSNGCTGTWTSRKV
jgi:hypothetical protein